MDRAIGSADSIFEGPTLEELRSCLTYAACASQIVLTDRLSNRVLAIHVTMFDSTTAIIVNVRFKVDPEILAHTLIEEFVHAQQVLDGVDFDTQRKQFPDYNARPYEIDAKQTATDILGYTPDDYEVYLLREEPSGLLYDKPSG